MTIEQYREMCRREGRFLGHGYTAMCHICGRQPVHKNNQNQICSECLMDRKDKDSREVQA